MAPRSTFDVVWHDSGRDPQCPPNPLYPAGIDAAGAVVTCKIDLPYPARRCGYYSVKCHGCGLSVVITTAGRPDDPRSVTVACKA